MPKSRFYNTELRGFILQHAIRQEFLTSEILKFIFRILKNKPNKMAHTERNNLYFQLLTKEIRYMRGKRRDAEGGN
jgi:hypothetical protein